MKVQPVLLILAACVFLTPKAFAQSQDLIIEPDEFQGVTKIKTQKLVVYENKETKEALIFTFFLFCASIEKPKCEGDVAVAIAAFLAGDSFKFSSAVIALADGQRLDLGSIEKLDEELVDGQKLRAYALIIKRDAFTKLASAKVLKMQIGGVISFTFTPDQIKPLKALLGKM